MFSNLKITAGINGQLEEQDIIELAELGANEFFCGVLPKEWTDIYGSNVSANRRSAESQFSDWPKFAKAVSVIHRVKSKVAVAFNALSYYEEQYPLLLNLVKKVCDLGADSLIVADMELLLRISELNPKVDIHVSSEAGSYNSQTAALFSSIGVKRIIFPRHMAIDEMKNVIANNRNLEYECFILDQRCPMEGAYCTSSHGWLKMNFCQEDFKRTLHKYSGNDAVSAVSPDEYFDWKNNRDRYEIWGIGVNSYGSILTLRDYVILQCGLCGIKKLSEIGITSLKVASRGYFRERRCSSVELLGKILRNADFSEESCKVARSSRDICDMKYMCYYR